MSFPDKKHDRGMTWSTPRNFVQRKRYKCMEPQRKLASVYVRDETRTEHVTRPLGSPPASSFLICRSKPRHSESNTSRSAGGSFCSSVLSSRNLPIAAATSNAFRTEPGKTLSAYTGTYLTTSADDLAWDGGVRKGRSRTFKLPCASEHNFPSCGAIISGV